MTIDSENRDSGVNTGSTSARIETQDGGTAGRSLTPEAKRALAEAEERRRSADQNGTGVGKKEVGGRDGPEPTRYGDWEKGGIASDF